MKPILLLLLLLLLGALPLVAATIPPTQWLSVQGLVTKPTGQRLPDGSYPACFRIFPTASGGTQIWEECEPITVSNGFYQSWLGDVQVLPLQNLNSAWVEVEVDHETLTGRMPLTGAIHSWQAQGVTDTIWSGVKLGENVAVRSLNGLKNDLVLQAHGTVQLAVYGDTLDLEGLETLPPTANRHTTGLLDSTDFQYFSSRGDLHMDSVPWIHFVVHTRGDGKFIPNCDASTEGILRYETHYTSEGSGVLMLCRWNEPYSVYAWEPIKP